MIIYFWSTNSQGSPCRQRILTKNSPAGMQLGFWLFFCILIARQKSWAVKQRGQVYWPGWANWLAGLVSPFLVRLKSMAPSWPSVQCPVCPMSNVLAIWIEPGWSPTFMDHRKMGKSERARPLWKIGNNIFIYYFVQFHFRAHRAKYYYQSRHWCWGVMWGRGIPKDIYIEREREYSNGYTYGWVMTFLWPCRLGEQEGNPNTGKYFMTCY